MVDHTDCAVTAYLLELVRRPFQIDGQWLSFARVLDNILPTARALKTLSSFPSALTGCTKRPNQGKHAIPESIGSEKEHKYCESDVWPNVCQNTKDHGCHAAKDKRPPVLS
jgi:hypothetical protein